MYLIKPYLHKALVPVGYVLLLMIIGALTLAWGNKAQFLNILLRRNEALEGKVVELENQYVGEEVVCKVGDKETHCKLDETEIVCDAGEYAPVRSYPNCTHEQCLYDSVYGLEGFAKLIGHFSMVEVEGAFGIAECAGFVVRSGSSKILSEIKSQTEIIRSDTDDVVIKLAIPASDIFKEFDRDLLLDSAADKLVELNVIKQTAPQGGVEACYSDYIVISAKPLGTN